MSCGLQRGHVSSPKKGDLVRLVKRVPLPQYRDEDIGKIGVVTESGRVGTEVAKRWVVVLLDGQFRLEAVQNLELVNAQD